jgi:DNA-binding NtrC family response regulator
LPDEVSGSRLAVAGHGGHTDGNELASIERAHIVEVLTREGGNKARAARALGINRRSLYRLIDKYEIRMTRETEQAH